MLTEEFNRGLRGLRVGCETISDQSAVGWGICQYLAKINAKSGTLWDIWDIVLVPLTTAMDCLNVMPDEKRRSGLGGISTPKLGRMDGLPKTSGVLGGFWRK
jgi:hypothetical protein